MSKQTQRYARLMGDFWRHPRLSALSPTAVGIHCRAMSYCAEQMTDGAIVRPIVAAFFGGPVDATIIAELVSAGVWKETATGYQLRDWAQHNITADAWAKQKAAVAKRVAEHRNRKKQAGNPSPPDDDGGGNDGVTRYGEVTNAPETRVPLDEGRRTKDEDPSLRSGVACAPDAEGRVIAMHRPKRTRCQLMAALARLHSERVKRISGKPGPMPPSVVDALERGEQSARYALTLEHLERLAEWAEQDESPEALFGQVLDGAERDTWMREKALPLKSLAENPSRYVTTVGGRAEPLPNSAYQGTTEAEADAMFGPRDEKAIAAIGRRRVV
jgi:hypothetical protein